MNKVSPVTPAVVEASPPDARNIHQRLLDVMKEVDYVQKDRQIPGQGGGYKVVTHDAVTAKVRPALVKHGVVYYPQNLTCTQNGNRTEMQLDIKFVNAAKPDDFILVPSLGYGIDAQDKGPGKAISYAVKMALLKALGLETGEDADDGTNQNHTPTPKTTAPLKDPTQEKNPPGRSAAVTSVRELCREVMACEDGDQLMALLHQAASRKLAVTTCRDFPRDWMGEAENSGLAGVVMVAAQNLKCPEAEAWVHKAEQIVRDATTKQAAEQ